MKKWYFSKTLWVNALAIAGIVLQGVTGSEVLDAQTQVAILGFLNLVLRKFTSTEITS